MARATFAAGCFWGPEEKFAAAPGVTATAVGYIGGTLEDPSYEDVCTGLTGHAEAVQVDFDPDRISYGELLDMFWSMHDPTTLNRQGPDHGTQYRSAIFVHDAQQRRAAEASLRVRQEKQRRGRTIVTEIVDAPVFWRAEEYHQRYAQKRRARFWPFRAA